MPVRCAPSLRLPCCCISPSGAPPPAPRPKILYRGSPRVYAAQASAAMTIDRAHSARGQTLEYSQSLNERNTFYFNRSTAGPSSGPQDPTMLPTVLELPPPSLEANAGSSPPPRISALSASAPASTGAVGRWVQLSYRSSTALIIIADDSVYCWPPAGEKPTEVCGHRKTTLSQLR